MKTDKHPNPLAEVSALLRRARSLPWDVSAQEQWRRRFNLLLTSALKPLQAELQRLEAGALRVDGGEDLLPPDLISRQRNLIADLQALVRDTEGERPLSTDGYVAIYERLVILESDVVRQMAHLGGGFAHDPRTLVGAACKLPGVGILR